MLYISEEAIKLQNTPDNSENEDTEKQPNENSNSEVFEPEPDEGEELIREYEDSAGMPYIPLNQNPFSSFNEQYVMLVGVKLHGERAFLVRESDLNAVKNYYECDCDGAIDKISAHNNIDSSEIVIFDESTETYKRKLDSIKRRILKETNPEKKNALRERLNDLRAEERERHVKVKLAKKINETYVRLTDTTLFGEALCEAEMYIHEALPMSDKNREKLKEIHDNAKTDPDKATRDLNKFYKEKDPETLISLFPSIKLILRCALTGAIAGGITAVAGLVGGPGAAMAVASVAPMAGVISGINDSITSGKVNAKYINKYVSIYEDEIEYLEGKKKKSKDDNEKREIDKLISAYKKSLPKLKDYQKRANVQTQAFKGMGF